MDFFELTTKYIDFYTEETMSEIDSAVDNYSLGSWVHGEGDAKDNLFVRMKKAVVKFFKDLIERIKNLFNKKEVTDILDSKDIKPNEKIQLSAKNEKLIAEGNITLKELDKCKSAEDVDKAMTKYRRRKAELTAIVAVVSVSAIAAIAYVHKKKDKELAKYKKDQEQMLRDLESARVQAAKERTEHVKEMNAAREKEESLYAKLAGKEKELNRLKKEKASQQRRGHSEAVVEVTKAKIEVTRDQAAATTNIVQEAVHKVKQRKGVMNKANAVKNAKADLNEEKHAIATDKVNQLISKYKQLKKKGIKLKSGVDEKMGILISNTTSTEDKQKAWEWLSRNEPKLHHIQSKAGTIRRGAENMQYNADTKYIRGLTKTGLNRIKDGISS